MVKKNEDKKPNGDLAGMLGAGYAHIQHVMDKAIAWGFDRMEETKAAKPIKDDTPLGKAEKLGRGVLSFFGAAGKAYFKTYEDLKKKDRPKK